MGSLGQVGIGAEEPKDWTAVHAVNTSAFSTPVEANLVDSLRGQARPIVLLVAVDKGRVVGHIMFSPVALSGHSTSKSWDSLPRRFCTGTGRPSTMQKTGVRCSSGPRTP